MSQRPALPPTPRGDWLDAEVITWQARYRIAAALLAAGAGVLLRLVGVVRAPAMGPGDAPWIGAGGLWGVLGLATAYAVLAFLAARRARSRRRAPDWLRSVVALGDVALVYGLVALLASPANYDRALVLSLFASLLAQLSFGTRVAAVAFRASVLAYPLMLGLAQAAGARVVWVDALVSLALYGGGGAIVGLVHASRQRRLAALARLFEWMEEGDFTHAYEAWRDARPDSVTAMGRAYDRMRTQLATIVLTDPLSGCLNRRGLEQQLAREVARALRSGAPLALVAVDLDRFKGINDELGHLAGDAVIRETGALLRETARAGDIVARVGGEEFLLVLPSTDEAGAAGAAARIVEAFRHRAFSELGARRVTASAGVVADVVRNAGVAEDLRARADEALYAAKRGGRDRYVVWRGSSLANAG